LVLNWFEFQQEDAPVSFVNDRNQSVFLISRSALPKDASWPKLIILKVELATRAENQKSGKI
jgi:hypothetical protein